MRPGIEANMAAPLESNIPGRGAKGLVGERGAQRWPVRITEGIGG